MTIEEQSKILTIIEEDFNTIKEMLDEIKSNIIKYPVYTQIAFYRPIKNMIFEAWNDSIDINNEFLNKSNFGDDSITI